MRFFGLLLAAAAVSSVSAALMFVAGLFLVVTPFDCGIAAAVEARFRVDRAGRFCMRLIKRGDIVPPKLYGFTPPRQTKAR